jgi:hypothetical protein
MAATENTLLDQCSAESVLQQFDVYNMSLPLVNVTTLPSPASINPRARPKISHIPQKRVKTSKEATDQHHDHIGLGVRIVSETFIKNDKKILVSQQAQ